MDNSGIKDTHSEGSKGTQTSTIKFAVASTQERTEGADFHHDWFVDSNYAVRMHQAYNDYVCASCHCSLFN